MSNSCREVEEDKLWGKKGSVSSYLCQEVSVFYYLKSHAALQPKFVNAKRQFSINKT